MTDASELLTRDEVCAYAGVGRPTLAKFISQGRVQPATRSPGGKLKGRAYNQNRFTRDQAERLKRYALALQELEVARRELR